MALSKTRTTGNSSWVTHAGKTVRPYDLGGIDLQIEVLSYDPSVFPIPSGHRYLPMKIDYGFLCRMAMGLQTGKLITTANGVCDFDLSTQTNCSVTSRLITIPFGGNCYKAASPFTFSLNNSTLTFLFFDFSGIPVLDFAFHGNQLYWRPRFSDFDSSSGFSYASETTDPGAVNSGTLTIFSSYSCTIWSAPSAPSNDGQLLFTSDWVV